ncbi:MAG: hypothetical protein K2Y42_15055 [Hyphomicrobium sp.]|jgi:hypothetical protein|uniref:hypothetical protein n=1 Tax=Hyphomicrobium sp. TaxID=82 RepID=UPI0025B7D7FC|nr:hypothetical protein [Hyphomicrobium sp.]MBX9864056.1 hypothetical protein [Hyphomicrobium sp.]
MDIIAWLASALLTAAGVVWALIWFLIGGWVSTLLQIAVLIVVIYGMKYGWRRAPFEIWRRTQSFGRFFWNWVRAREPDPRVTVQAGPEVIREIRVHEFGDINISTVLSLAAIVGLCGLAAL